MRNIKEIYAKFKINKDCIFCNNEMWLHKNAGICRCLKCNTCHYYNYYNNDLEKSVINYNDYRINIDFVKNYTHISIMPLDKEISKIDLEITYTYKDVVHLNFIVPFTKENIEQKLKNLIVFQ